MFSGRTMPLLPPAEKDCTLSSSQGMWLNLWSTQHTRGGPTPGSKGFAACICPVSLRTSNARSATRCVAQIRPHSTSLQEQLGAAQKWSWKEGRWDKVAAAWAVYPWQPSLMGVLQELTGARLQARWNPLGALRSSHTWAKRREPRERHWLGEHNLSPLSKTGEVASLPCVKAPYISLVYYHKKYITSYGW